MKNKQQTIESLILGFKEWLRNKHSKSTNGSRVTRVKRITKHYNVLEEYAYDHCASLIDSLTYTRGDKIDGNDPKTDIVIDGDYVTGLSSLRQALLEFVSYLDAIGYVAPATNRKTIFIGGFEEFKRYVGPKCRNEVNVFCKKERELHQGICEYCQQKAQLQSAHVTDRPIIIDDLLEQHFKKSSNNYEVNLEEFFGLFKKAHEPIRDKIFFLCKSCHTKLDKYKTITIQDIKNKRGY